MVIINSTIYTLWWNHTLKLPTGVLLTHLHRQTAGWYIHTNLHIYTFLSINYARPPLWRISGFLLHITFFFCVSLAEIWIHQSRATLVLWLPWWPGTLVQFNSMSRQRGTKHSYKLFSLLHSQPYILVWRPHIIYHMNNGYIGAFNKYTSLVLGHRIFVIHKPLACRLGVYQWQTSSDLWLGSYICQIHLPALIYILHICDQASEKGQSWHKIHRIT